VVTPPLLDAPAVAVALLLQHSPVDTVMPPLQRPPPSKLSSNCHTILCQSNPLLRPYTATLALFHCYIRSPSKLRDCVLSSSVCYAPAATSSRRRCYAPSAT